MVDETPRTKGHDCDKCNRLSERYTVKAASYQKRNLHPGAERVAQYAKDRAAKCLCKNTN